MLLGLLFAKHASAANYTFQGDATMSVADGDLVHVGGLLTADISGGTAYAGSLDSSSVTGGDIHVTGAAHATTMTGGNIEAGSLTSATLSAGTIRTTGDATITTLSVASVIAGGTVTTTTMTSGTIEAGAFIATTVTGGLIRSYGDAHVTTLSGATMVVDGAASFTTIASGVLTVNGPVTITTISSGSFTLNGDVVLTTFSDGELSLNGFSTSILTLSGGTINLGPTNLTLYGGSFAGTFCGGSGTITKAGAGTLTFAQPNAFGGTLLITKGVLAATVTGALSGVTAITVRGASLLAVDYNAAATLTLDATATATISGANLALGAVINANSAAADPLNFTAVTGTITLLSLSGVGLSNFGNDAAISGGITNGTVKISGSLSAASITGGDITVASVATIGLMTGGTLNVGGPTASVATLNGGTLNLGAAGTLTIAGGTMTGTISGTGAKIAKTGPGMLTLASPSVLSYSGGTTILDGVLRLGASDRLPTTGDITISGGTLDLYGFSQIAAAIKLTRGAIIDGRLNGLHFDLKEGYVSASLEGTGDLVKSPGGEVTLAAENSYSGGTAITAGTLVVAHDGALGTGPVTVNGGTLVVNAVITNPLTVGPGGTLAGTGSMGLLTLGPGSIFSPGRSNGGITMNGLKIRGEASLTWNVSAGGTLADADSTVINGGIDLSDASPTNRITIRIVSLANPADLNSGIPLNFSSHEVNRFIFMTYGTPLNLGTNSNIADLFNYDVSQFRYSDTSSSDASLWSMSYSDTPGQMTLTAIPEASTYGLGIGALGLAAAAARRRNRKRFRCPYPCPD